VGEGDGELAEKFYSEFGQNAYLGCIGQSQLLSNSAEVHKQWETTFISIDRCSESNRRQGDPECN
jgi:hypothetical protein